MRGTFRRQPTGALIAALALLGFLGIWSYSSATPIRPVSALAVQADANGDDSSLAREASRLSQNATSTPSMQATVKVATLNVRSGPSTTSTRLSAAKRGDVLKVVGQTKACQWLKVVTPNKTSGWVLGVYVTLKGPCSAVPAVATPVPASKSPTQQAPLSLLPAPVIVRPEPNASLDLPLAILGWSPVKLPLGPDDYYVITIQFKHGSSTWTDYAHTRETQWYVREHAYLTDVSSDGQFDWMIQLFRATGWDAQGAPLGVALSQASEPRRLILNRRSAPPAEPTPPDCGAYCPGVDKAPSASELLTTLATLGFGLVVGMVLVVGRPVRRKNDG